MTEVKGTAVAASLRYATETLGTQGYRSLLDALTPEHRTLVEGGILASGWYPLRMMLDIMQHTAGIAADPRAAWKMGRASADYALTTVYKIFFKVGSPQFVISKASSVFKTYYTTGQMTPVVSEKGHALLEITGFADPSPILCDRIMGWMERTVELSGAKSPRIVHPQCLARGDAVCRYEGWWT
jgi:hypothetical protein